MRLIDADKLCVLPIDEGTVENAPTVDAVAVIRCKDCMFATKISDFPVDRYECYHEGHRVQKPAMWFCADAEKRDE